MNAARLRQSGQGLNGEMHALMQHRHIGGQQQQDLLVQRNAQGPARIGAVHAHGWFGEHAQTVGNPVYSGPWEPPTRLGQAGNML